MAAVRLGLGTVVRMRTYLFCAWLAWSRYRIIIPTWDKTLGSVLVCLDRTLRRIGATPTYALTDNERTVSMDRIAGISVRNPTWSPSGGTTVCVSLTSRGLRQAGRRPQWT